jgi:hypothetical protein
MRLIFLAARRHLLEEDAQASALNVMLQQLASFLLDKIVQDYKTMSPTPTAMEQVCGFRAARKAVTALTRLDIEDENNKLHSVY